MKSEEVLALFERFPELIDDEDLVEALAVDIRLAAPAPLQVGQSRQSAPPADPFNRRWESKPAHSS